MAGTDTKIANGMLAEFEREIVTTRRFLERLPADKLNWRPHEKSMTAGQLSFHIASLLQGVLRMAELDESQLPDLATNFQPTSLEEILQKLDESEKYVKENLGKIDDDRMHQTLKVKAGDHVVMEAPRVGFIRSVLLNHCYHHRGQFGVYLRLLGASVPSSYGPSGDEMPG